MGRTNITVTPDIAYLGLRVCRGRDWDYSEQDTRAGIQHPGKIVSLSAGMGVGWMQVQWDHGGIFDYRVGNNNRYDLYVWEDNLPSTGSTFTSVNQLRVGQEIMVANLDDQYMLKNGLRIGDICTVTELEARELRVRGKDWWVPVTCFMPIPVGVSSIPHSPIGPVITNGVAEWSGCTQIIKIGLEVMVINDSLSSWVKQGGLKIGDIVTINAYGSSTFTVKTPLHGNLNIDRRCFGLPNQGVVGSVFINRKIKITANERRTSPRGIQVRRQTPSVRSAKTGGGRSVRG